MDRILITLGLFLLAQAAGLAADLPAAMVRLAKPPVVDGDAGDWKDVTAVHEIRDQRGDVVAWFKLGWDDQACHALFKVRDDSPLKNSANVIQELFKGGDAVGLCLGRTDGAAADQRIVAGPFGSGFAVMAMRPKWPDKSPYRYFTTASGELVHEHVAALAGAQVAAKPAADGYVLEMTLPWKELGLTPGPGTVFSFDAQVVFSNPGGTANAATAWWRSVGADTSSVWDIVAEARLHPELWGRARCFVNDPGSRIVKAESSSDAQGVPIHFELPRPAHVSLVVKDASGWIVAEPIRCTKYAAGKHVFTWNGRDRLGLPLPPGKYQTLIGYWDDIRTEFVASVGNSGRPPFLTKDGLGSIGGAHGGIGGLAADATGVYMGQISEEGQPCLRKIDPATGKALWFSSIGVFAGCHALAADGKNVWSLVVATDGKAVKVMRLDAATGRPAAFGGKDGNPTACVLNERSFDAIAVASGKIYLSERGKDRLAVIDDATGQPLPEIPIEKPSGLCRLDDQTLLVGSGGRVVRLDLASGKSEEVAGGLAQPRALALDGDGVLYVSDLGASQQIKIYRSTKAGTTPSATIGVAGGRPSAVEKWNPLQFRDVSHLAIGPDGNLWCAERWDVPRRFIKLTRDGKHLEDFFGPSGFATMGIDLDDPAVIYYTASQWSPHVVQSRVDFEQYGRDPADPWKGWKLEAIHELTHPGAEPKPDLVSGPMTGGYNRLVVFKGASGVRYLWKPGGAVACLFRWDGRRWLPAATVKQTAWQAEAQSYWSDLNGDGAAQAEELAGGDVPSCHWIWIDRDLTLHGRFGSLKPKSIDARGVPVYQGGAYTALWKDSRPWQFYMDQSNYDEFGSPPTADGSRWFVVNAGADQGRNFWDRASETRLFRVGPDGKVQFVIGHHDGVMPRNGDNQMLMNLAGEMDGVLFASEVWSCFTAYTSDGLTLGWVNRGPDGGVATYGPASVAMENVAPGFLSKDPATGQRRLAFSTTEDVRIIAVDGIWGDQITRLDGTVELASSRPRAGEPAPGNCLIPASTWVHGNGGRYLGIDGYDTEWDPTVASLSIRDGEVLVADLRLRRDNGCLQVMAEVVDDRGWAALSADAGAKGNVFGSVPAVELMLGPALPDRKTAATGDTRIVLSAQRRPDGSVGGVALACRPASEPLVPGADLRPRDSAGNPSGPEPAKTPIDWTRTLQPIPGAQVAVRERFDRTGWRLEAEIPLAAFPDLVKTTGMRVRRQNGVNGFREVPDTVGAFKFNTAVWVGDVGQVRRLPWVADGFTGSDPTAMAPATWGMANAAVTLRWNEVDGATAYRLYRSSSPDPATAVAVKTVRGSMETDDLPGIGEFWYWLAPVGAVGEGQWLGPVPARESAVNFPACDYAPPVALADLAKAPLDVFPGHTRLLNVAGGKDLKVVAPANVECRAIERDDATWTLLITPRGVVGPKAAVTLRDREGRAVKLRLAPAPVPVTAHGAECAALTIGNSQKASLNIDSSASGPGESGKPAALLRWQGQGDLPQREIGRHGFALICWKGDPQHRRVVKAPFVDTFADFKIGGGDFGNLELIVDGDNPGKGGRIAYGAIDSREPGSQFTIRLQADDRQPHLITVLADKRGGHASPPVRWLVGDPATKRQWVLREHTGDQGVNALQFRFIGAVDLTAVTTAYSDEFYNRVGISAIFLD